MKMQRKIASGASNWKAGECSGHAFSEQQFSLAAFSIGYSYSGDFHDKCIWCISWSNKPSWNKIIKATDSVFSRTLHWIRSRIR